MIKKYLFLFLLIFIFYIPLAVPETIAEFEGIAVALHGSSPEESGEAGEYSLPPTAILNAAYRGDAEMVREILATFPDKNIRNAYGDTALHLAMFQKSPVVIRLLLDYGFDPNAKIAKNGYTPLHNAVMANNLDGARLLLQYGANKNLKNLDGLTPLDKARKEEKRELVLLLMR